MRWQNIFILGIGLIFSGKEVFAQNPDFIYPSNIRALQPSGSTVRYPRLGDTPQPRPADQPTMGRIVMNVRGMDIPLQTDYQGRIEDAGVRRAGNILASQWGPTYKQSSTWRSINLLNDPKIANEVQRSANLSTGRDYTIRLVPGDGLPELRPGTQLVVPSMDPRVPQRKIQVQPGESLPQIAQRENVPLRSLQQVNGAAIWPHVSSTVRDRGNGSVTGSPTMVLGEQGVNMVGNVDQAQMILHEAGHLGQNFSPTAQGGTHSLTSVTNPGFSFAEGAANARSVRMPEVYRTPGAQTMGDMLANRFGAPFQTSTPTGEKIVAPWDQNLGTYLSNEMVSGGVVYDLSKLPPGWDGVDAATRATNETVPTQGTAHLGTFLGQYLNRYPEQRSGVEGSLRDRTFNSGSDADYNRVLTGGLPQGLGADEWPLGNNYQASPPPADWDPRWAQIKGPYDQAMQTLYENPDLRPGPMQPGSRITEQAPLPQATPPEGFGPPPVGNSLGASDGGIFQSDSGGEIGNF